MDVNTTESDELLPEPAAARYIGDVPAATLRQWRYRAMGPEYIRVGRHIRYRRSALDAWLEAHTVRPSAAS